MTTNYAMMNLDNISKYLQGDAPVEVRQTLKTILNEKQIQLNEDAEARERLRLDLMEKVAKKQPHEFIQYDCFLDTQPDSVMTPDKDGDCIFWGEDWDLRNVTDAVRVTVPKGVSMEDARRALKKIRKTMKKYKDENVVLADFTDDLPF